MLDQWRNFMLVGSSREPFFVSVVKKSLFVGKNTRAKKQDQPRPYIFLHYFGHHKNHVITTQKWGDRRCPTKAEVIERHIKSV